MQLLSWLVLHYVCPQHDVAPPLLAKERAVGVNVRLERKDQAKVTFTLHFLLIVDQNVQVSICRAEKPILYWHHCCGTTSAAGLSTTKWLQILEPVSTSRLLTLPFNRGLFGGEDLGRCRTNFSCILLILAKLLSDLQFGLPTRLIKGFT